MSGILADSASQHVAGEIGLALTRRCGARPDGDLRGENIYNYLSRMACISSDFRSRRHSVNVHCGASGPAFETAMLIGLGFAAAILVVWAFFDDLCDDQTIVVGVVGGRRVGRVSSSALWPPTSAGVGPA